MAPILRGRSESWTRHAAMYGVGSKQMRDAGVRMLADASTISVVGITEVLTHIRAIYGVYAKLKQFLREERPDVLVLIDFPDFNIMLGKAAQKLGIPVVYYISPQVWVWRKGRIKTIAGLVKAMIVVFPFEVPLYEKAGVDVRFVGHPLTDVVRSAYSRDEARRSLGLAANERTIALMPGSRRSELANLLPDMLRAAQLLRSRYDDLQFVLPVAHTLDPALRRRSYVEQGGVPVHIVDGQGLRRIAGIGCRHRRIRNGHARDRAHGRTHGDRLPDLGAYVLYAHETRSRPVQHVGLVNIVAGQRIVPELIQHDVTPQKIADADLGHAG